MGALGETFYLLANQVTFAETMMMFKALVRILIKIQVFPAVWLSRGLLESAVEEADMKVSNKGIAYYVEKKKHKHKSQPIAPNQHTIYLKIILKLRVTHSNESLHFQNRLTFSVKFEMVFSAQRATKFQLSISSCLAILDFVSCH